MDTAGIDAAHPALPTIRLDPFRSVGPATLDSHLVLQGDNLAGLAALAPRYAARIQCAYLDPPYAVQNTPWVYDRTDRKAYTGCWSDFMAPRLRAVRTLLAPSGVVLISIDDQQLIPLRLLLDTLWGPRQFIGQIIVQTNPRGRRMGGELALTHEYVICYAQDITQVQLPGLPKTEKALTEYRHSDNRGQYRLIRLRNSDIHTFNRQSRPTLYYPIFCNPETGSCSLALDSQHTLAVYPVNNDGKQGAWTWSRAKVQAQREDLEGRQVKSGAWRIYRKDYLTSQSLRTKPPSVWTGPEYNYQAGKKALKDRLGPTPTFRHPKPPALITRLLEWTTSPGDSILDPFAGSGTTGEAVLALNRQAPDRPPRQVILLEQETYADTLTAQRLRAILAKEPDRLPLGYGLIS